VGVTTHQGERESRSQGEGAQVLTIDNDGEVREMRNAATVLAIIHYEHWRAGCPESGHVRFGGGPSEKDQHHWHLVGGLPYRSAGSGRGRRKRTRIAGTSPAAYFTRRGAVGKGPVLLAPRRRPTLRLIHARLQK
jgi:hypothetical protein